MTDALGLRPRVAYSGSVKLPIAIIDLKYKKEIQTSCILGNGIYQTCVIREVLFGLDKGTDIKLPAGSISV